MIAFSNLISTKSDRPFINSTYICLIAFSKTKMIAFLKFNQQDDSDRTISRQRSPFSYSDFRASPPQG
jgi:hypothetical protein